MIDIEGSILTFGRLLRLGEDCFAGMKGDLKEEEHHGDNHPDVNHLDVGCGRQRLGDAYEAENRIYLVEKF